MTTFAVLGAGGMLGRAWVELLRTRDRAVRPIGRPELDLTDEATVAKVIDGSAEVVVNCAAYTDVDGAEADEGTATQVNGHAVGWLVRRADEVGARLVHYSTDYVFAGQADAPYPVDAPTAPVNAYGRSKLVGEQHLRASPGEHLLIRTSWLYAPWGKNFVRTIHRLARERDHLRVVDDQRGRPTRAEALADTSLRLVERSAAGVFHGTDSGECSWYDLARHIAEQAAPRCRVDPCGSDEFPRPAPRPSYSVLDVSGTDALVGPAPGWRASVSEVVERLATEA